MSFAQADIARRPGPDAQAVMAFEARKKSIGVAYLIWLFFAGFGAHRFYAGRTASGLGMLLLSVAGWIMLLFFFNFFVLAAYAIWVIVDAFLIPRMISDYNTRLAMELGGGGSLPAVSRSAIADDPDPDAGARADAVIARYLERTQKLEPAAMRAEDRPVVKSFGMRARAP